MKKFIKRISGLFMAVFMMCGVLFPSLPHVKAANNPIYGNGTNGIYIDIWSEPYSGIYKRKADIIAAGIKDCDAIAYTEVGCTWFAAARAYQLTGKKVEIYTGAHWFYSYYANYGFTRGSEIKAKALVCYKDHVAVIERVDGDYVTISEGGNHYPYSNASNGFCAIRVMKKSEVKNADYVGCVYLGVSCNWYDDFAPQNPGQDFYANIVKTDVDIELSNVNGNVELGDKNNIKDYSDIWHFVRQSDGSYVIYNGNTNNVLTPYNDGGGNGTNVIVSAYEGKASQKWFIYGSANGEYILRPEHSSAVLDVTGNNNDYGTNIELYDYNGTSAQKILLREVPRAAKPELTVNAGDFENLTDFHFSSSDKNASFKLYIDKDTEDVYESYRVSDPTSGDNYTYSLPTGYYRAVVSASNGYSTTNSDYIYFTVAEKSYEGEDGWTYSEKLYPGITEDSHIIEYNNIYKEIAASSPAEGYEKGRFIETKYENKGSPYESDFELPVSDERVYVGHYYYHWCGAGMGKTVNYFQSGGYNHYDSIDSGRVYEAGSHNDYDNPQYIYYDLKWRDNGQDAYCHSGVTCDGSGGAHGNRSSQYYKKTVYQDRTGIDYNVYIKESGFTSEKDENAPIVKYRYKIKDSYTVNFEVSGKTVSTQYIKRGQAASAPVTPANYYDDSFHYVFSKWDKDFSKVNSDMTVKALFSKSAHSYTSEVTVKPTTETKGERTYKCSCGRTYTEEIPAIGHEHDWNYCDKLPAFVTPDRYEVEYNNIYKEVASSAPGEGYIKGEFIKSEYENKGQTYTSAIELPTSDERVLVSFIYYHYCGPTTGNVVNHTPTDKFPHWDSINPDLVYEAASHHDYEDSRYIYYDLKWKSNNQPAYCEGGVTCDGSWGAHAKRSSQWYKQYTYQDRVKTDYFNFIKESGFVPAEDLNAQEVKIRYRLKDNPDTVIMGDVDGDKNITASDARLALRASVNLQNLSDLQKTAADADRDKKITASDARLILRASVGLGELK